MPQTVHIGSVILDNLTILAPMAGITNLPFRLISKKHGCGLVCSEMISANGLVYGSEKTFQLLDSVPEEKPLSVQIFGSEPEKMAEAAKIVEASGADILDINFGCAVRKVVKTGSGVALMKDPVRAESVLKAVRKAIRIPLTIKIRTGWDASGAQALELCQIAEASGVDAITVHPRTASQAFSGTANWSLISEIKHRVSIPVIGNGDIQSCEDAIRMKALTGCDAVMVGRGSIGNPWIFTQISDHFSEKPISHVDLFSRFELMVDYLKASTRYCGEENGCRMLRSRLGWFTKGLRYGSRFRESIRHISTENEALELIRFYMDTLAESETPEDHTVAE